MSKQIRRLELEREKLKAESEDYQTTDVQAIEAEKQVSVALSPESRDIGLRLMYILTGCAGRNRDCSGSREFVCDSHLGASTKLPAIRYPQRGDRKPYLPN